MSDSFFRPFKWFSETKALVLQSIKNRLKRKIYILSNRDYFFPASEQRRSSELMNNWTCHILFFFCPFKWFSETEALVLLSTKKIASWSSWWFEDILLWFDLLWFGLLWFGLLWFGSLSFGSLWFGLLFCQTSYFFHWIFTTWELI